ncbi:MAG TPA: cytochrome c oxidase subunit II [Gemmataceae bacterium]|jgi:cytochrome c oxidase subunit 2|nr:cytochrome c oxidase subunit II [Gemmataceae bacterium]
MILQTTMLPPQASEIAWHVDNLIWFISAVCGITGLGVYGALLYFCIVYRRKVPNQLGYAPTPRILGSHKMELAWTVIPLVLFLGFFAWGAWIYNMCFHEPPDAPEIYIVGKQWMWKIQYPEGQRVILGQNSLDYSKTVGGEGYFEGVMVLPVNRPVKIITTSEDVIHDFGIPAFRQKIDVVPGRYTSTWYLPTKTGTYDVFCDQYCGTNHSLMVGKVVVVDGDTYTKWLAGTWSPDGGQGHGNRNAVDGSMAHQGRQLFMKLNCIQCHNTQNPRAPVLEEIFGTRRQFKDGTSVIADDEYLRESIRKPRAKVREGWEAIMPHFGTDKVSPEDLNKVVAYIKSLKKGDTPVRTEDWVPPVGAPTEERPQGKSSEGGGPK